MKISANSAKFRRKFHGICPRNFTELRGSKRLILLHMPRKFAEKLHNSAAIHFPENLPKSQRNKLSKRQSVNHFWVTNQRSMPSSLAARGRATARRRHAAPQARRGGLAVVGLSRRGGRAHLSRSPYGSRGCDRANFGGLVLGCIEAKFCK